MVAGLLFIGNAAAAGQQPPPIAGVTGTVALEGTVEKSNEGVETIVVKAVHGIEHLFRLAERAVVHGSTAVGIARKH